MYDSARGLLWNSGDDWIVNNFKAMAQGGRKLAKYIEEACPRISVDGDSGINHFGLISYLKNYNAGFGVIINEMASVENEHKIIDILKKDFFTFFIPERRKLIEYIITGRFKKVREI